MGFVRSTLALLAGVAVGSRITDLACGGVRLDEPRLAAHARR